MGYTKEVCIVLMKYLRFESYEDFTRFMRKHNVSNERLLELYDNLKSEGKI